MRLWGKPAMIWPTRLDAGRLGSDASLALAIDCTGVLLATCIIVVDRCVRVKVKPRQARVGNAAVVVGRKYGGITAIKCSNSLL
jgi:hypothetical protein